MSKKEHDYDGMDNQGRFIPEKEHFHIRVWNTVDWIMKGILYSVLATGSLKDIEIMDVVAKLMVLILAILFIILITSN
tara:strand:- start:314 stop:547 length:234 start_codon:yes stop_codon:yes gene_type:complete